MNSRDYYKVTYATLECDQLDNETEFNANQFKLFDDFTTDLRISFNPLRNNYHEITAATADMRRRQADVDLDNGNRALTDNPSDLLENEVMVDPWSSMDSSNSPLTDSGPSASEDCTPSTSSELPRAPDATSPLSPHAPSPRDRARARDLTLDLEALDVPRRPHFLDEDYQPPSRSNIECRIPKPHFLDHSPSPDEFDERSDITNPNFLDDEADDDNAAQKKAGALPKRPQKNPPTSFLAQDDRHRTSFRSALHYGLESAARSSERDKRASQLYRGTWPGEWTGQDSASVRSFSSNGSADGGRSSNLENKMECVYSLISLLSLSPENNADLSGPLLEMSRSGESCIAMRQSGCIPLLVQLIHSKVPRETRDRAAKALRNIILTQTDDKAGRREARVWRLLEQVREYCYVLEQVVEMKKEGKEVVEADASKHPSQSVAALMKLSFDEEHRHVVCQLGGLQALAALVSGDQAAHGSRTADHTCLTMRKYAGMTLTNLTFGDGNNKSLLCSFKDFMMALVDQLQSPNDDMRQVTAAVLRNLSWRADANSKQVLREVGAVRGLTAAAMTCSKEATLKSVLSALWNLTAHCSMNKVALCSVDGALGFLVDMLSYDSPTKTLAIVENAGGIMRNVSSHIAVREDYRQILRERNCLSVLLQHLKSPSLTVVSNSCGTLWNLSARCPRDQEFLWDRGAVPMLRSLIHSKHKMIAMGSSAALKNLLNSKPGKTHIISLDTTARSMNLPALPTLGVRKQKALEQELDQNLAETCDNIEPVTSPTTSNREEKNLFTATERQMALNLERHRMSSSSPLVGALTSQLSLSHSAQLASYLSCSNSLLKGALGTRSAGGSDNHVNRSDSKDSVTSTHSDSVFDRVTRPGKVPVPTPRNKDLMKNDKTIEVVKPTAKDGPFPRYPTQPPVPPPRSDVRTNYTESGYDVDQDSCDQPIDYSRKYSETKTGESDNLEKPKAESTKSDSKKESEFGDYQETDLDQPTDYSLRYAEHHSETGSDLSEEPPGPSDTIKHFATEGTPYETPIIFSTATSMSDLRVIGKDKKPPSVKENPEIMTHSDEKDTCSIEDPPHDNDVAATTPQAVRPEKQEEFDTKFSSGTVSPEKPVNYCEEGTPGYFSRVSSLSSVGEPTEEDNLAKKNAMATINVEPSFEEPNTAGSAKEGSKAVTFASSTSSPRFIQDTPLMFSRSSSLGSLPDCEHDDQGSVLSEFSRLPSGCLSPSEIPDSPGVSPRSKMEAVPLSSETEPEPEQPDLTQEVEQPSVFVVEHTPAQFSCRTSLSSLTIDDDPRQTVQLAKNILPEESQAVNSEESRDTLEQNTNREESQQIPAPNEVTNSTFKEATTPRVYCTEDTPARMSAAGSRSDLSLLSVDSSGDSDLLEECIQKGIAKVVKNKGPPSDVSSTRYSRRDDLYRSLPPYLRSSTETVKMSRDLSRSTRESPPPLPPRQHTHAAPPRPPPLEHDAHAHAGRSHTSRQPDRLARHSSQSSLSLESFGSTDREIFEETVKAGLSSVNPRAFSIRSEDHSLERPIRHSRHHRSLDRSDKISQHRPKIKDPEFERNLASGAYKLKSNKMRRERDNNGGSESSASNESFGSTDKEVFERIVRRGMALRERDLVLEAAIARGAAAKNAQLSSAAARAGDAAPPAPRARLASARSNECLAVPSGNTTLESVRDDLDRSNESCAEVLDASWSDEDRAEKRPEWTDIKCQTDLETDRLENPEWTDIKCSPTDLDSKLVASKISTDTWNDNTCPDDVTFPTISASVHLMSSIRSEIADPASTLPDLLEKSEGANMFSRPDLTDKLDGASHSRVTDEKTPDKMLESITEPSFASLVDDGEQKFDSIVSSAIEQEAARLAAQLKTSHYVMENSVTSLTSLDLDNVRPPSNLGSLLSLSASGQWDETSTQIAKKSQRSRKKSLPIALVKKALSNSMHHGSSEHLDSNPVSFLENVNPPSEMETLDMESSMVSVSSIVSEAEDGRERIPIVFDFKQPIQELPMCMNITTVFQDLDKVNPPSLFDEMAESTLEIEQTTAHEVFDDCVSNTLNVITDIPSGSENGTPLPSDVSSVESTPKRRRDPKYLTPKEKRHVSKDRYQTYTITDTVSENDVVLEVDEEFLTWTKSESDRSEDFVTATSEAKSRRKVSAKQRRLDDRARYQTQTVDIHSLAPPPPDPALQSLKQRLADKKTSKQKRIEDADRFRTRTLSEDIPPSPTFVTRDANFENVETTTGYDSLSSNDLNHQQIMDDVFSRDDSGHNEDDGELNSTRLQTYTKSFRNYLPVVESPTAVDLCVVNNLKNIEMTASYRRTHSDKNQNPSSSDFASYEGDSTSEDRLHSESDPDTPRPKPKIIKPPPRDESLDSNDSLDREPEAPKAIRGRKKATYVSPYRRNTAPPKKTTPAPKPAPKASPAARAAPGPPKAHSSAKTPARTPVASKPASVNTSPKKSAVNRSPTKIAQQKAVAVPLGAKPLPLERQGTFTKEDSTVPPRALPAPPPAHTSPSRLPLGRHARPAAAKPGQSKTIAKTPAKRQPESSMKSSPSTHSLQSTDSGKTVTLSTRGSSSKTKEVESKIASLWKKVEQAAAQPAAADRRVWIAASGPPRLTRSSTFEGSPAPPSAPKQKTAIGLRASHIPSLKPKATPVRTQSTVTKKQTTSRLQRKPVT